MILRIIGHDFHYEIENLCRVYFPFESIVKVYEKKEENDNIIVTTELAKKTNQTEIIVKAQIAESCDIRNKYVYLSETNYRDECERLMAVALFEVLTSLTGYKPDWGILTGVRPSKLMTSLIIEHGQVYAERYFQHKLLVSNEKTRLAVSVANAEKDIVSKSGGDRFSLYVSIPFCPSRCSYCSFVSHSISSVNAKKLLPQYIENLCAELESIGDLARELGIKPQTVYFGGGTPTSIEADDLARIVETISSNFDIQNLDEYTVEAGRPDTITEGKLGVLSRNGVTRISINPQTFNDMVLKEVGRNHSAQCAIEAYRMAEFHGFNNINMDLIAGLPYDSLESFKNSLNICINLMPKNITVHTLALKRSSELAAKANADLSNGLTAQMLDYAQDKLGNAGFHPYYMYRQSRSLGNLENIGWSQAGYEGIYNVFMMEECQTVLAAGAGAVTKLKQHSGKYIQRIFNFKYPYEYNSRFDEMIERKHEIKKFYSKYNTL